MTELRQDLIHHYEDMYSTDFTLSPLIEKCEVSLSAIYIKQNLQTINLAKDSTQLDDSHANTCIKSYKDLFRKGSGLYKNIYITGKAGVGKTVLSKRICQYWCKAHSSKTCTEQDKEDVEALRQFEFIFVIPLDESDTGTCDIDEMIEKQIINRLSRRTHYSKTFLAEVLHNQSCLVILDGLDKWTHPQHCPSMCRKDLIPQRPVRQLSTIMTTSCHWKFNALRLNLKQIDRHVNIGELDEKSSGELITKVVPLLNKTCNKMSALEIEKKIVSSNIDDFRYNPYLILQLICLLLDGKPIGNTKCEVYCTLINLLLIRRHDVLARWHRIMGHNLKYCPPCLLSHDECKENFGHLLSIGRLAFGTLCTNNPCSEFEETFVNKYMQNETLDSCLHLGILTRIKTFTRKSVYTFYHKSFQIYFAALFAQSERDQSILRKVRELIVRNCISDDSDMFDFFVFIYGFSPTFFRELFDEEGDFLKFRNTSSIVRSAEEQSKTVRFYQCLVAKCFKESLQSTKNELPLPITDIIIDSDFNANEDIEVLRLCVEKYGVRLKSVCIRECGSQREVTNVLQKIEVRTICSLRKIELRNIPATHILQTLMKNNRDSLYCLDLCSFEFEKASCMYHNKVVVFQSEYIKVISQMKQLQVLTLASFIMDHRDMDALFQFLKANTKLRHIVLYNVECRQRQHQTCKGHTLDLSLHENLNVFGLDHVPLSRLKIKSLNIEECWIGRLSSAVLSQLFTDVQTSRNLHTLYCLKHDDICPMLQALPSLHHISDINFRQINLGNRVVSLNSKCVKSITLTGVTMSSTALRLMLDSIEDLPHEVEISLEDVTVNEREDFDEIKRILLRSPEFKVDYNGLNVRKKRLLKFRRVSEKDVRTDKRQSAKAFIMSSARM